MIGRLLARLVVAAVVLAALVGALYHSIYTSEEAMLEPEEFDQRYLAYVAAPGEGPTFRPMEGTGRLRILSFLHLPETIEPADYDPEERFIYGLRLRVLDDGQTVETRDIWKVTRTSRMIGDDGGWQQRGSYYPLGAATSGEPADLRLVDVDLGDLQAAGRTVRVEMIPTDEQPKPLETEGDTTGLVAAGAEVNIVAFSEFERPETTRGWQTHTLSERRAETFGERARLVEWTGPTAGELDAMLQHGWRRQTTTEDVQHRSLYNTEFRRDDRDTVGPGEELQPGRALAYSLEGPARFEVSIMGDIPREIGIDKAVTEEESDDESWSVDVDQQHRLLEPVDRPDGDRDHDSDRRMVVDVDEGMAASLRVRTVDDGGDVSILSRVDRPEAVAGDAPIVRRGDNRYQVGTDRRRFDAWQVRSEAREPIRYQLRRSDVYSGDALRLSVRHRPASEGDEPRRLHYRFRGTDMAGSLPLDGDPSPFESVLLPVWADGDRDLGGDGSSEAAGGDAVSDVQTHRFWIPPGAESLELWVDEGEQAWVSAAVLLLEHSESGDWIEPYDRFPPGFRWRYAPVDERSWLAIGPTHTEQLIDEGRRHKIEAQVRWIPQWSTPRGQQLFRQLDDDSRRIATDVWDGEDRSSAEIASERRERLDATVVRPRRARLGQRMLEELSDVDASTRRRAREQWDGSWRAELRRGQSLECQAPAGSAVDVEYRLDSQAAGNTLEVWSDGEVVRRQRLLSAVGQRSVPVGSEAQTMEVRIVDDEGESVEESATEQWWTNCIPEAGQSAGLWRVRRVYSLEESESMVVEATSDPDEQRYINVVAYLESPTARLRAVVDGGQPGGRASGDIEQITVPTRQFELESHRQRATFPGPDDRGIYGPVRVAIPIGSDWESGDHDIRLTLEDGGRIWTRFFTLED